MLGARFITEVIRVGSLTTVFREEVHCVRCVATNFQVCCALVHLPNLSLTKVNAFTRVLEKTRQRRGRDEVN